MTHRHITAGAATATVLVAIAALLGACTDDTPTPTPTHAVVLKHGSPTPRPSHRRRSVDPEMAPAEAAILDGLPGILERQGRGVRRTRPKDPGPGARAVLRSTRRSPTSPRACSRSADSGIKVVGCPDLSPEVSDDRRRRCGSATITDCVDGTDWKPIYIATGESAAAPGQAHELITTSTAYFYVEHWTIRTSVVDRDAPC